MENSESEIKVFVAEIYIFLYTLVSQNLKWIRDVVCLLNDVSCIVDIKPKIKILDVQCNGIW